MRSLRPGNAALVDALRNLGAVSVVRGVDRRAAREERPRLRRPAVVLEGPELGVLVLEVRRAGGAARAVVVEEVVVVRGQAAARTVAARSWLGHDRVIERDAALDVPDVGVVLGDGRVRHSDAAERHPDPVAVVRVHGGVDDRVSAALDVNAGSEATGNQASSNGTETDLAPGGVLGHEVCEEVQLG